MASKQTRLGSPRGGVPVDYEGQLGDGELIPTVLEEDGEETRCPHCGEWRKIIASHWSRGDCSYPPISQYKMNLCTGMLMGDGNVDRSGKTPRLEFSSVNKTFLNWLTTELGWLGGSVTLKETSVEKAQDETSVCNSDDPEDYYDSYRMRAMSHPTFDGLASWYDSGEKVYPVDLTPSPELLKMWYVSDGTLCWSNKNPYIKFKSEKEKERPEAIQSVLNKAGFTVTQSDHTFFLPTDQTEDFLNYLGDPVSGFAYKFATESREQYQRLKEREKEVHRTQTIE